MPDRRYTIFAAVLAAGLASRFGATKQVSEFNGVPLVVRAVETAAKVCDGHVVTAVGHDWMSVLALVQSHSGFVVLNDDYEHGLGTSIATAARACRGRADALLVLLADQPLVTAQHLQTLVDTWSGAEDEIVASSYSGTQGPPVLFAHDALSELVDLTGDVGARALFTDTRFRTRTVTFEPAAIDIDRPSDLAAIT